MYLFYNYCVLWAAIYLFNLIMYVMFLLRPFTVHNVFPCFYRPNKVIIIIIILLLWITMVTTNWTCVVCTTLKNNLNIILIPRERIKVFSLS